MPARHTVARRARRRRRPRGRGRRTPGSSARRSTCRPTGRPAGGSRGSIPMPPRIRPSPPEPSTSSVRSIRQGYSSSAISAGRIAQFERVGVDAASPGASRPGASAAAQDVGEQRQPARAGVDGLEDQRRERHLAGGDRALGQQLAEPFDQHVGQPLDGQVARAQRRREGRVEQAALRGDARARGWSGRRSGERSARGRRGRRSRCRRGCSRSARSCPMAPAPSCPSNRRPACRRPPRRRRARGSAACPRSRRRP